MSRVLRVGLVGFGAVAQVHLEAYRSLGSIRVAGVTDTNPARLELARTRGLHAFATLGDMLAESDLDLACVLTPAAYHESATVECANANVHVLCEKPLATSLAACERMIAACEENDVLLCYGASYRFLPAVQRARELILSGEIGEILLMRESAIGGRGPDHRETLSFAHYPAGEPGGSGMGLVDHGIHLIDTFPWLMNTRTSKAYGRGNISGAVQAPEVAVLHYDNGATGYLLYEDGTWPTDLPNEGIFSWGSGWDINGPVAAGSWNAQPGCIHVHGTAGALRIFHYANKLYATGKDGPREIALTGAAAPAHFAAQLEAFVEAISNGGPAPVTGESGALACRTLLEIYSDASTTRARLPVPGRRRS